MFLFIIAVMVLYITSIILILGDKKDLRSKIGELEDRNRALSENKIMLEKKVSILETEDKSRRDLNSDLCAKINSYEKSIEYGKSLIIENEKQKTQIEEQRKSMTSMAEVIEKMKNEMLLHFKNISNDIINQQKNDFEIRQKETFGVLLSPLNQQLDDFNKKITNFNKDTNISKAEIKEKIDTLVSQTTKIGDKADNLADALKNDKKTQGNWGEMKLKNLLELSGLKEDEDFFTQKAEKNKKGETVIFDFVVRIPGEKHLIMDSKVSIVNYEKYIATNVEEEKKNFMKLYCNDIKNHIEELGKKEYHKILKTNSPDFVFMFLPLENAYIDAINYDRNLYSIAMKNKVAMVTASSLIPVVNMINNLWNIEKQNKNINDIVGCARRIYKKIKSFVEKMDIIEKNIDNAKKSCVEAKNYLQSGNGNVLRTVDEMIGLVEKNKDGELAFAEIEDD
jgi:DNA recombination protein RmuC